MLKVLFVCTGNICRSPTAEGVLRALDRFGVWPNLNLETAALGLDPRAQF